MIPNLHALAFLASLAAGPDGPAGLPRTLADDPVPVESGFLDDEEARARFGGGPDLPAALQSGVQRSSGPSGAFFGRVEGDVFAGAAIFDSTFKAGVDYCAGLLFRVPTPGIFTGNFGIFAEGIASHISRDAPGIAHTSGLFYAFGAGLDYTFLRQESWWLAAQAGGTYLMFGNIAEAQDGFGAMLGLMAGIQFIKRETRYSITINPQFTWDGSDWVLFANVGFLMRF